MAYNAYCITMHCCGETPHKAIHIRRQIVMNSTIHMLQPTPHDIANKRNPVSDQMGSYIIISKEGKVIVIDGGWKCEAKHILRYISGITGQKKPHIDAWILSHPHPDHVQAFIQAVTRYRSKMKLDKVYYNFCSIKSLMEEDSDAMGAATEFYKKLPRFADVACIVTAGDKYVIGDVEIEFLYTPYPIFTKSVCNNSSLIFKITIDGKSALFLSDVGEEVGDLVLERYKGTGKLKSDVVQMAHHGYGGVNKDFYAAVAPTTCLWPTPARIWYNDAGDGYNTYYWDSISVQKWMAELGVTDHRVLMNGTQIVEL